MNYYILALDIMECNSPDEDPLDSCLPVNCHMKYSGYRGFYSMSEKKCVEIPMCKPENEQVNYNTRIIYIYKYILFIFTVTNLLE